MSSKQVLITGAAGFIGSHLTERCLEMGWRVTAIDGFLPYYDEQLKRKNIAEAADHPRCTFVEGNLLDLDLGRLAQKVSVVFHFAAQAGVRTSWDAFPQYVTANIEATQRLLDAVKDIDLDRFILASSSSIYGDAEKLPTHEDVLPRPVSPYGVTKLTSEHLAAVYRQSFRIPTVCLRLFTVYGPRQRPDMAINRLTASALANEPFTVFGDGEQTRDFTYVSDVVRATIAASTKGVPGSAYNIGGGARRSMNSVFALLEGLLGRSVPREYQETQLGDARDTGADTGRAQHDLRWGPAVGFEEGLKAQVEWQAALMKDPERRATSAGPLPHWVG
ncbi:MAG TPA: NAD-dependent epimerase/dehydratase family protein [Solirubrobacteraceae bacterium]|nr:NAD-dependent epimerase/dehydratase family protein [Solirubrobacteraceae bacterium]